MRDAARRLAVIPARAGSRRVPGKNVRPMCGRPLLAWTVDAALASGCFDRVVVSTDSEAVARLASAAGAEAPFLRPADLADDVTPVSAATVDALERLDPDGAYASVAQLMANCPLRTADDIRASCAQFEADGAPAQLSVTRFGWQQPWWALEMGPGHALRPVFPDRITARSQDLPEAFCTTGAVWWARAEVLRTARTFHVAGRTGWAIGLAEGIDIDVEEDWAIAEALLAMRLGGRHGD